MAAKPKFDPNQSFEIVGGQPTSKPKFDSSKSFEAVEGDGKGILDTVMDAATSAGKFVDSYTGSPTRSALMSTVKRFKGEPSKNPLSSFISQFGENSDLAPTGEDISKEMGISNKTSKVPFFDMSGLAGTQIAEAASGRAPSKEDLVQRMDVNPAAVTGLGIDLGADVTNLLPMVASAKITGKVAKGTGKGILKGTEMLGEAAARATGTPNIPKIVGSTVEATKHALAQVLKPKQAEDFGDFVRIAEKNAIDPKLLPESVEFGPNSVISRGSRSVREGPAGQMDMDRFQEAFHQIQGATNKRIEQIGGGKALNDKQAGQLIREGFDQSVGRLFDSVDDTYNSVLKKLPNQSLTPESVDRLEKVLGQVEALGNGRVMTGIQQADKAQGQQLLQAVKNIRNGYGYMPQAYNAMKDIGRKAFQSTNYLSDVPVDKTEMKKLYFALRDAFVDSTGTYLGDDVAKSLKASNEKISEFLGNKNVVSGLVGKENLAPEDLFNSLVVRGDSRELTALKNILAPEQIQQLKGALLENLIRRDPDGTFNFRTLHNAMRSKENVLAELFDPKEITDFAEIVKLGDRLGPGVLSTPNTGGSILFSNMLEGIKSGAINRGTLDAMKDAARNRQNFSATPLKDGLEKGRSILPQRTSFDDTAKALQAGAVMSVGQDKEKNAMQRRLERNR